MGNLQGKQTKLPFCIIYGTEPEPLFKDKSLTFDFFQYFIFIVGAVDPADMSSHKPAEQLSTDDYFRKNGEFRVWLRKHRDLYFDTLDASEARKVRQDKQRSSRDPVCHCRSRLSAPSS